MSWLGQWVGAWLGAWVGGVSASAPSGTAPSDSLHANIEGGRAAHHVGTPLAELLATGRLAAPVGELVAAAMQGRAAVAGSSLIALAEAMVGASSNASICSHAEDHASVASGRAILTPALEN